MFLVNRVLRFLKEKIDSAPTQLVRSRGNNGFNTLSNVINDEVDIELPSAMRIWKHRNSRFRNTLPDFIGSLTAAFRFHSILYNFEAVQTEESWDRNNSDDNVAFFHPLKFDEEVKFRSSFTSLDNQLLFLKTLHRLVSYFGCLEKFSPLQAENPSEGQTNLRSPFGDH